jgi:hypothetical protein
MLVVRMGSCQQGWEAGIKDEKLTQRMRSLRKIWEADSKDGI